MADPSAALVAEVLAWLAANPAQGDRAAARRFGVPRSTIQRWRQLELGPRRGPASRARRMSQSSEPVSLEVSLGNLELRIARLVELVDGLERQVSDLCAMAVDAMSDPLTDGHAL